MNCKNCKFWTRNKFYKIKYKTLECICEEYTNDLNKQLFDSYEEVISCFGECSNKNFIYTESESKIDDCVKYKDSKGSLLYSDGEGYEAYFIVGENFGCKYYELDMTKWAENV